MNAPLRWADLGEMFDGPHATPTRRSEGPYFLNIASLKSGRLDLTESDHVAPADFAKWTKRVTPRAGDLLFSYETRLGEVALMPDGIEACLGRRMALLRPNRAVVEPKFLLYLYLSPEFQRTIAERTVHGATVPRILLSDMPSWPVGVPPLDQQWAIAEVLGALDDKIAANVRLIEMADALAAALFEDGLDTGYEERPLAEVAVFHNRKRVPLSAKERDARPGAVPYFGAAGRLDYVDEALFDEQLLLVGEDGSVVQEDGRPVTQYIWGPSWVNNHAHVLTGHGVTTELLRLAVRRSSVLSLVTGAVQPKISMRNLKSLPLELPTGHHCDHLSMKIDALTAVIRRRTDENRSLTITRDALLPPLMSGRVTVKDAEKVVEGVA